MQGWIGGWLKGTLFATPMVAAWLLGLFQAKGTWLVLMLVAYYAAPNFGITPLTPPQLVGLVLQKPDSWVAIIALVVAVVAAGSFLDSKRLDMRLAAADDIQLLLKQLTDVETEERLAAEALVAFRQYAERYPKGTLGEDAVAAMQQVAISVISSVPRVSKQQGRMWEIYKDAISLRTRHRLALSSSSVCLLMFNRGLSKLEELASSRDWIYPLQPESLDDLHSWAADSRSGWVEDYSPKTLKLAQDANFYLGGSAGSVAGLLFPTSAVAAWDAWTGVMGD